MEDAHPRGARPRRPARARATIEGPWNPFAAGRRLDSSPCDGHDQPVPIYDYACTTCDERFDELVRFDAPPPPCPSCGNEETERQLSTFLTPNMASGQRKFQRNIGSAMAEMGCCGGGGCGTHAG
jgi:putative FmdB family regulatory protein